MSYSIRNAVNAYLVEKFVDMKCALVGATKRDDWECDQWRVTFTGPNKVRVELDYFTGVGHRKVPKGGEFLYKRELKEYHHSHKRRIDAKYMKPVAPCAADILYSMVMDSSACDESFDEWCANLGYDTDSRKALETYLACQQSGKDLSRLFGNLQTVRDMVQDY